MRVSPDSARSGKKIIAAVKADAYGHGLAVCATTLAPFVDAFATAFCEEAKALHALALDRPVLVLEGPFDLEDWETIIATDSWAVLHSEEQLTSLESLDRPRQEKLRGNIWLKVDTGMHRLGVAPNAVASLLTRLARIGYRCADDYFSSRQWGGCSRPVNSGAGQGLAGTRRRTRIAKEPVKFCGFQPTTVY